MFSGITFPFHCAVCHLPRFLKVVTCPQMVGPAPSDSFDL